MAKKKFSKIKILSLALSLALLVGLLPTTVFASGEENGYDLATATSRKYNGTAIVDVTDMIFAGVFVMDNEGVSADATGTLSSYNAGNYTVVDLSNIVPKGEWVDFYDFSPVVANGMKNVPTDVTISKVNPTLELSASPNSAVIGEQEIAVTVTITNNFDNNEGLPTADEIELNVQNASIKSGSSVVKNGNIYSATYVVDTDKVGSNVTISANVSDKAINYSKLDTAISILVPIVASANYSSVDEQIKKAEALNRDNYVDFSAVEAAVNAVVRGKNITEQESVNSMAKAIEEAIKQLVYKDADYTGVDEQIKKAEALNKDNYVDFSAVEAAVNAVVRGKNITEQESVNSMADAIENAIKALELKPITPPATAPTIIEGANQSIEQGKGASFKSDADLKDFKEVLVDNKEISSDNYTLKEGSTIVTLKSDFIKTLSVGKHTLSIVSSNGSADTEFTVTKAAVTQPEVDSPQTGDSSSNVLFIALCIISVSGVLTLSLKRRKSAE